MKVKAFIRTSDKDKPANVRFRLSDGRLNAGGIQLFHKSEITVLYDKWDEKAEEIKARVIFDDSLRKKINKAIRERRTLIENIYGEKGKSLTSVMLETEIDKVLFPEKYETPPESFFDTFTLFLERHNVSDIIINHYRVVFRALQRYELYTSIKEGKNFTLALDNITPETLQDLTEFLRKEHEIRKKHPEIYKQFRQYHEQKPRGKNTINGMLSKLRTFFIWCVDNEKTTNNPFKKYSIEESVFGTPYYITIEERNILYQKDFAFRPELEIQRDIFVFQCLIGCRIADLYKFTKQNVINGAIEYIARKTKDGRPVTIRVPLNAIAKEILKKYANFEGKTLLPYIHEQKYNEAIKAVFRIAKITRPVVVLDPLTREGVVRPINEVASSHLARRCFVGNLYKQVKDPNLVGALSGHKEGSRAFARYREIDEVMKIELVKMLE